MLSFLWTTFWGKVLCTFLISMVPVIELRGAIPIAVANGLPPIVAIPVAVFGNILPTPFIILFVRSFFDWMKRRIPKLNHFVEKLEQKGESKKGIIQKGEFLGLLLFVAIPLPGTGAWTGALIAAMLNMRLKNAFPAIALGVISAGLIVAFVSYGVAALF